MKNFLFVITSLISIVTLGAICILGLSVYYFDDSFENEFADYNEMINSATFEKGWLPEYLPTTSVNIKESHDLDTNHGYVTFTYDATEKLSAYKVCVASPLESEATKFLCPPYYGWKNILVLHQNGNGHFERERAYYDEESKNL